MRTTLIILAIAAITAPHTHAQQTTPLKFHLDILYADGARIVGTTGSRGRSALWSYNRTTAESETLYATPHYISLTAKPVEDYGVILVCELRDSNYGSQIVNNIVVDMRHGQEPTLKILPASNDEGVTVIGVHEESNQLILYRHHENSRIEEFFRDSFSVDFTTQTLEFLNLETWESEIVDLPVMIWPYRSFVHEDLLYFNGNATNQKGTRDIYTYDLVERETPTKFAANTSILDARVSSGHLEILLDRLTVARVVDGKLFRQRSFGRAPNFRAHNSNHLYRDGVLSASGDVFYSDVQHSILIAEGAAGIHTHDEELFIIYPNNTAISVHNGVVGTPPIQLDIPHAHLDYLRTIPFNNDTRTNFFQSTPGKIAIIIALLTAITINIAIIRRKRTRDEE